MSKEISNSQLLIVTSKLEARNCRFCLHINESTSQLSTGLSELIKMARLHLLVDSLHTKA